MAKTANAPRYSPPFEELLARGEADRWMQRMGWPLHIIESIMVDDNPDVDAVRRLVYRVGPIEAKRRIIIMLSE